MGRNYLGESFLGDKRDALEPNPITPTPPRKQQTGHTKENDAMRDPRTIVALRQGMHLLTTFHPELTKDDRFHEYFVKECVLPTLGSRSSSPA